MFFRQKNTAYGKQEDLTKLITCQKIQDPHICRTKKVPTAGLQDLTRATLEENLPLAPGWREGWWGRPGERRNHVAKEGEEPARAIQTLHESVKFQYLRCLVIEPLFVVQGAKFLRKVDRNLQVQVRDPEANCTKFLKVVEIQAPRSMNQEDPGSIILDTRFRRLDLGPGILQHAAFVYYNVHVVLRACLHTLSQLTQSVCIEFFCTTAVPCNTIWCPVIEALSVIQVGRCVTKSSTRT